MHLKYISKDFKKSLFDQMFDEHPEYIEKRKKFKIKIGKKKSNCLTQTEKKKISL